MQDEQMNEKTSRTLNWYINRILFVMTILFFLTGVVIALNAAVTDNTKNLMLGLACIPATGIIITPNIVLLAVKNNRSWKDRAFKDDRGKSFAQQILQDKSFCEIDDTSPYHSKVVGGVVREAIKSFVLMIVFILAGFAAAVYTLIDESEMSEWFAFKRWGRYAYKYDVDTLTDIGAVTFILAIIIFLIPILAYFITGTACRIRSVCRHDYLAYRAVASGIDRGNVYIKGEKGKKYGFRHCKRLGIKAKQVHDTKAVLVLVPDREFLLPIDVGIK